MAYLIYANRTEQLVCKFLSSEISIPHLYSLLSLKEMPVERRWQIKNIEQHISWKPLRYRNLQLSVWYFIRPYKLIANRSLN